MRIHRKLFILLFFLKLTISTNYDGNKLCKRKAIVKSRELIQIYSQGPINLTFVVETRAEHESAIIGFYQMRKSPFEINKDDVKIYFNKNSIRIHCFWRIRIKKCDREKTFPQNKGSWFATNIVIVGML